MKIIEVLKELPIVQKRIDKNIELIRQYSSRIENDGLENTVFGTAERQQQEVDSLLQSTNDLVSRAALLRKVLALTNASVEVTIDGETHTILEWISLRESGIKNRIASLKALTNQTAEATLQSVKLDVEKGVRVVRFYDESTRNKKILREQTLLESIDAQLEIINATTDVVGL